MKPSFEQCCDEVAKKYNWYYAQRDRIAREAKEAAELFHEEGILEAVELVLRKEGYMNEHFIADVKQEILEKLKL